MRIVMIGHSSVGKTTFMASMYGAMNAGVNGFSLRAEDKSDHNRFLKLYSALQSNRYPAPTDQRAEYQFQLCHDGKAFFPFTWVDIRGGTILDHSETSSAKALVKDLTTCDGVLVFCDAAAAARGDEDANEMARISQFVSKAVGSRKQEMPLGIVFTKSDLVDEINDAVLAPVEPLMHCVAASKTVLGTIIPVACGSNEYNVALPVLFALYYGIVIRANALAVEVQHHATLADAYTYKANEWFGLGELWREFNGEKTYTSRANEAAASAQQQYSALEPLIEPAKTLEEMLDSLIRF